MMERETVNALIEAAEALRRAQDTLVVDDPGDAKRFVNHALGLIESILSRGR